MHLAAVRSLVADHRPVDALEEAHQAEILAMLDHTPGPLARDSFDPGHITASAFVLAPTLDRLLLIWHSKLARWLQPGGHLDAADADVFAAARREVAEETGLTDLAAGPGFPRLLDVDVHVIPPNPKKQEPAHRHFDLRIALVAASTHAVAGDDALAVRWVDLSELTSIDTDESVRRAAARLRASLG